MQTHATTIIGLIAGSALIVLNIMLIATICVRSFRLWPVPSPKSWQNYVFWTLFRGGLGLTIVYAILTVRAPASSEALRFASGIAMIVIGFGITIYGYFDLGIENTYGADDGLVTGGMYRYSRNPQCVSSILGFLGIAVAHGGGEAVALCLLSILVYILMPFTEEPWLQSAYGDSYLAYKARVPRFILRV